MYMLRGYFTIPQHSIKQGNIGYRRGGFMHTPENLFSQTGLSIKGHMELNGNHEAVVEGCSGILEYGETVVRVCMPGHTVRFTGRGLNIQCLTADALVVTGYITGIEFLS